ncbi:F-actin-monooxygenase MICAL2-like [Sorex fumeus]|uniref:F-actin-monooxygenase MICAL2-like n=1 Tax=Sorex fumeus TaxID=62283 RepID=UPI0024AD3C23|nr:F-actin-monooxygenase MICAL2-like [Sorex fumeus]
MNALQRANSLRNSTPSRRRTFQSNPASGNGRAELPVPQRDESPFLSASSSSSLSLSPPPSSTSSTSENALEPSTWSQVAPCNPPLRISRGHFSPSTQSTGRQVRVQEAPTEIPIYLPHGPKLEQEVPHGGRLSPAHIPSPRPPSPARARPDGPRETDAESHGGALQPWRVEDRFRPDLKLPPGAREDQEAEGWSTGSQRGEAGGSEPKEGKKTRLKKLELTAEQKSRLLDWDNAIPDSTPAVGPGTGQPHTAKQGLKSESPSQLLSTWRKPLTGARDAREKTPEEQSPGERMVTPPKSPLQIVANAFRSFFPSSDSGKKAATSAPHAYARSLSLRSATKDWKAQATGRASSLRSWGTLTARTAQPAYPNPMDSAFRTRSLPNRASKMFPAVGRAQCSRLDDVPSLLEKVSLQETFPDAGKVPKRSFFSSLRLKDKPLEYLFQEPRPRKELWESFSSAPGSTLPPSVACAQPQEKLVQPLRGSRLGRRVHPEDDASPQLLSSNKPEAETLSSMSSTASSSADEESNPLSSLQSKEKKTLKRRKKLERETKQLVKQAELKRLYKAQDIQRQLEEVEEKQRALEIQGVWLEKALRGEAADSGTQDEAQLLQEWFELVLEKNKLMRYESELLIMARELELEDHQSRLEQKLREKMLKEESQKDEKARNEEEEIIKEMMQVIEQRDRLVDSLEKQRIKEKAEDQHFESFVLSMGCQMSRT